MLALQKYWQTRKVRMLFFASFLGLFTFMMFMVSTITIVKQGLAEALKEPAVLAGLTEFPAAFLLLLLLHKVINAYLRGRFFSPQTLHTLLVCAKLAMLYGLVLKPGVVLSLLILSGSHKVDVMSYFSYVGFSIAIVGFILHVGVSAHKISREIEQEQELVI